MSSFLMSGLNLQDSKSVVMREFSFFHDMTFYVVMLVSVLMGAIMVFMWYSKVISNIYMEEKVLEMFWTLLPAIMLIFLALPSLKLLFFMESPYSMNPSNTIKVVGYQLYWSFSKVFKKSEIVDKEMFMVNFDELNSGEFNRLEVDSPIPIHMYEYTRFVTTANDVLHSFALPTLGLKMDAVPGRLNQQSVLPNQLGVFYGQCSEICGANHSFMPVSVEVVK